MEVEQTGVVGSTRGGSSDDLPSPLATAGPIGLADWRGDVALELWVETDVAPVRIRMAGRLDATTAANLDEVIRELLADGTRHIELSTDGLRGVDSSAVGALADVERRVRRSGGTLLRVAPMSGPFLRTHPSAPPPGPRR